MNRISVIIPVGYHHAALAREAVASVKAGTMAPHEIVVVDDGAEPPVGLIPGCRRVTSLCVPVGRSAARNLGAREATGDWLFFLDADDRLEPRAVEDLLGLISGHPELGAAFADYKLTRGGTMRIVEHQPWSASRLRECWDANIGLLLRRGRFLAVGGFDEGLDEGEEWDMMLRYASNPSVVVVKNHRPLIHVIDGRSTPRGSRVDGADKSRSWVSRGHEIVLRARARLEAGEYQEWATR